MSNPWQRRAARAKIEIEGREVVVPDYPEWTFRVRPLAEYSADYQRAIKRIAQRPAVAKYLKRAAKPGYVSNDKDAALDAEMIRDAFAEACVAGWEGVTDRNGEPLEHNVANVTEVLSFFPDIYRHLQAFASTPSNFEALDADEIEELAAGN